VIWHLALHCTQQDVHRDRRRQKASKIVISKILLALVRTYNAGLSFALLLFLLLRSQSLLKILHYCPISPCIQHCICIAALLGKYYIIIQFSPCIQKYFELWPILTRFGLRAMLSEIFRVSTNFDRIWITRAAMHSEIFRVSTNFDHIWITRALVSERACCSGRTKRHARAVVRQVRTCFALTCECG
jgi:hypothetical protein